MLGLDRVRLIRASDLAIETDDPSQRLVLLCRAVGGTTYLAGRGGNAYMDLQQFADAGIAVQWQNFDPASTAYLSETGENMVGLSVIDALFHLGAEGTIEMARRGWAPG